MHALEQDIAKYRGKYDAGYDAIRRARFEREQRLGLIGKNVELSPDAGDWSKIKNKAWEARCMEVYAAMVDCMDRGIGRIVDQLREQNQLEYTLIFFLQDNGGCAEPMSRMQSNGKGPENLKPFGPNDLQPQIWPPMQTRDGHWVRRGEGVMPGPPDTYIAYGKNWANVSNTPFREYKHWVHEGGISTPLIVHWPAGIPRSQNNRLETQPGHLVDLMATCVDLARARYPDERNGERIKAREGVSLVPAFTGHSLHRKQPIFWEHEGNRALRDGNWKLVAKDNEKWELYDMSKDRSEIHDLAEKYSDRVKTLVTQWDKIAARADVLPLGAWHGQVPQKKQPTE
jgi:arylsulfatase